MIAPSERVCPLCGAIQSEYRSSLPIALEKSFKEWIKAKHLSATKIAEKYAPKKDADEK
jgi:hypothetical protein